MSRDGRNRKAKTDSPAVRLVTLLVLILVVVSPWCLGATEPIVQTFIHLAGAVCLLLCLRLAGDRPPVPWLVVPVMLAVVLGCLHLVPGGAAVTRVCGSHTAQVKQQFHAAGADQVEFTAEPHTLSSSATRRDLTLLIMGLSAFLCGVLLFRTTSSFALLCRVLAINAAAITFVGIAQLVGGNGRFLWFGPELTGSMNFGPFVYHNQAGNYLAISVAALVGWWVLRFPPSVDNQGAGQRVLGLIGSLDATKLTLVSLAVLLTAGLLASLSRGACLSMSAACGILLILRTLSRGRFWPQLSVTIPVVAAIALLSWVGMTDTVSRRLGSLLRQETILHEGRLDQWSDNLAAVHDYWGLGSGLGTYRFAHRPYQTRALEVWFTRAHNQYLEAITDTGLAGLGLLLAAVGLMLHASWRLFRSHDREHFGFGLVGLMLVLFQAVHAVGDYCLYLPPNLVVTALLSGAVSARAAAIPGSKRLNSRLPYGFVVLCLLGSVWAGYEMWSVARMEQGFIKTPWNQNIAKTDVKVLESVIREVEPHVRDDPQACEAVAALYINVFRLRAREQLAVETGGAADAAQLWKWTSPVVLHHRSHVMHRTGNVADLEDLRTQDVVRQYLIPALHYLKQSRAHCPLLSGVHVRLAELSFLEGDPTRDEQHLERARLAAPASPSNLYEIGRLAYSADRFAESFQTWKRCLELSHDYADVIVDLSLQQLDVPELIELVLPTDPELLLELAQREPLVGQPTEAERLAQRALAELIHVDLPEGQTVYLSAVAHSILRQQPAAVAAYRSALQLEPLNNQWRFELARLLWETGDREAALTELRKCIALEKRRELALKYEQLLTKIRAAEVKNSN